MRWTHKGLLLAVLAAGWCCGSAEPSSPLDAHDPEMPDDNGEPGSATHMPEWVRLGVGFRTYETLVDGDEVELVRGPQNHGRYFGYHIWLSVEAKGYLPDGVDLDFRVENVDTSTIVGDTVFKYGLRPVDDAYGATGLRALIRDCCAARGAHLKISLDLADSDGHLGHDEKSFVAGPCLAPEGELTCP